MDKKPKLLWRPALACPRALLAQAVGGSAKVAITIDRGGLARLPRMVKATNPEFGWAALTLANGLRFEQLNCGGNPTELKVIFPVSFTPPAPVASAPAGPDA